MTWRTQETKAKENDSLVTWRTLKRQRQKKTTTRGLANPKEKAKRGRPALTWRTPRQTQKQTTSYETAVDPGYWAPDRPSASPWGRRNRQPRPQYIGNCGESRERKGINQVSQLFFRCFCIALYPVDVIHVHFRRLLHSQATLKSSVQFWRWSRF